MISNTTTPIHIPTSTYSHPPTPTSSPTQLQRSKKGQELYNSLSDNNKKIVDEIREKLLLIQKINLKK